MQDEGSSERVEVDSNTVQDLGSRGMNILM